MGERVKPEQTGKASVRGSREGDGGSREGDGGVYLPGGRVRTRR